MSTPDTFAEISVSDEPIPLERTPYYGGVRGADVQFLGVVRRDEGGRALRGIRYSAYVPMAEKTLRDIAAEARRQFGDHAALIHHRIGFVAVDEASVILRVAAGHSPDGFALCRFYLDALKTRAPIWKEPVFLEDQPSCA